MKMKYNTGRLEFMKFVSVTVFPSLACVVYMYLQLGFVYKQKYTKKTTCHNLDKELSAIIIIILCCKHPVDTQVNNTNLLFVSSSTTASWPDLSPELLSVSIKHLRVKSKLKRVSLHHGRGSYSWSLSQFL